MSVKILTITQYDILRRVCYYYVVYYALFSLKNSNLST